jgi:predicted ATPase
MRKPGDGAPRIEYLRVQNYRALEDLELRDIKPLTVFLGPNGSGKSTIFDTFAFLSECFSTGLRKAWDKRGRFKELRTKGKTGPITFHIKYRESKDDRVITYRLAIDEDPEGPFVAEEWLQWRRGGSRHGQPFKFLNFHRGSGSVVSGDLPEMEESRVEEKLSSREVLAVSTLGQLAKNPRVSALRQFVSDWYLTYLTADNTRGVTEAGPQEHLSQTGDNLPNVMQYLKENHPGVLDRILLALRTRIPRLQDIDSQIMADGRLLLQIKDAPFSDPILAKYASDGTLKMLAYLTVLYDPAPAQLIGIEEPENQLHPRLLIGLSEECRKATERTQLLVTTHSPEFVDGLRPSELWVLYRDEKGYTKALKASEMPGIPAFIEEGALLGQLWMEGYFPAGDPLINGGDSSTLRGQRDLWS